MQADVPRLLAVSDGKGLSDLETWIGNLVSARVEAVLIREKQLDDRRLFGLVGRAVRAADERIDIVVSGRADIAIATGAVGVHLPSDGIPIERLRARFGSALLIGRSTHAVEEVVEARDAGADYVTFGPVWDTPSKRGMGSPTGIAELRTAAAQGLPVLALGGVEPQRLRAIADAGAHGAAAIRMLRTPDAIHAAKDLRPAAWNDRRST